MVLESSVCVGGAALASHGRGHRFNPCHAHQHNHSARNLGTAACQQIGG
jgi:hypothetical protein